MGVLLIVSIRGSSALDVPSEISPSLLISVVVANVGVGKEVCAVGVIVVRVRGRGGSPVVVAVAVLVIVVGGRRGELTRRHGEGER